MSVEHRVEYLLRAAARAEREGNARLATVLRKMASELGSGEVRSPDSDGAPARA